MMLSAAKYHRFPFADYDFIRNDKGKKKDALKASSTMILP